MKHWHRCERWERRKRRCPFSRVEGHEREEGETDEVTYQSTPAEAPERVADPAPEARPTVGVREPRRPIPRGRESAAGVRGHWQIPLPPYAVDIAAPEKPGEVARSVRPFRTREDWELPPNLPGEAQEATEQMEDALEGARGFEGYGTREDEAWFSRQTGGQQQQGLAAAEIAAAEGVGIADQDLQTVQGARGALDSLPLFGIPILEGARQIFRVLQKRGFVPPGRIGAPGRADAAYQNPFQTGANPQSTRTTHAPRAPAMGAQPVRQGGFGVRPVDAAAAMRRMIGNVANRRFNHGFRQADPDL